MPDLVVAVVRAVDMTVDELNVHVLVLRSSQRLPSEVATRVNSIASRPQLPPHSPPIGCQMNLTHDQADHNEPRIDSRVLLRAERKNVK